MSLPDEVNNEMQQNILSRLKKIEGQLRGLHGMVSHNRECESILTQLRAAQAALKSMSALVLKSYLTRCFQELQEKPIAEELCHKLEKSIVTMTKFTGW